LPFSVQKNKDQESINRKIKKEKKKKKKILKLSPRKQNKKKKNHIFFYQPHKNHKDDIHKILCENINACHLSKICKVLVSFEVLGKG